jgi:hypothetical protein
VKRTTILTAATVIAALSLAALLPGCGGATAQAAPKPASLIGTWFDDLNGTQYRFVSDSIVVVPRELPGGGNALTYSRIGDDRLDILYGTVHRVSMIDTLTADSLVLADPLSDEHQLLRSDAGTTTFASQLATTAVEHANALTDVKAVPDITWVTEMPADQDPDWTSWSVSTLDAYALEWDWSAVKKAKGAPIVATGGGPNIAFAFTLERKVPTAEELMAARATLPAAVANTSVEPTAGLKFIDVGYSAAKADYAAGTLVYINGGLIYSLGDGYAIPVALDYATSSFVPVTHK